MVRYGGAMAGLPVWGAEKRRIEKIKMGGALDLSGPRLMMEYPFYDGIQQST
jgi:hypothetical protein